MRPTTSILGLAAWFVVSACMYANVASGAEFIPVDGAAEQLQSRRYETGDPKQLLQASLAILQDIRYLVSESESEPGLLVAQPSWAGCRCTPQQLTISIAPVAGQTAGYQVRLSIGEAATNSSTDLQSSPVETDFYQDFFTHLDRELFRENQP